MKIDINKSQVYAAGNVTKTNTGLLSISNEVVCVGDLMVSGGNSNINYKSASVEWAILCTGDVDLNDGSSHQNIAHKGTISSRNWNFNEYRTIRRDDLDVIFNSYDYTGYFKYISKFKVTGTTSLSGSTYTLKGNNTKNINVFEIAYASPIQNIHIDAPLNSHTIIKIKANAIASLDGLTITHSKTIESLLILVDASSTTIISNSTVNASFFCKANTLTIRDCQITGSIYANNINFEGNNTLSASYYETTIPDRKPDTLIITPESVLDIYDQITVEIEPAVDTDYYEIRYTIDGTDPTRSSTLYTGPFELYKKKTVVFKATLFGNGVSDGKTVSKLYGFRCKCEIPNLVQTIVNGHVVYSVEETRNGNVYFTLDDTDPTEESILYNESVFNDYFAQESEVRLKMITIDPEHICDSSSISSDVILVDLPDNPSVNPRCKLYYNKDSNLEVEVIPGFEESRVITTAKAYSIREINEMEVRISYTGDSLVYSTNNKHPYITYNAGSPLILKYTDIGYNKLKMYATKKEVEFTKIVEYSFVILTNEVVSFGDDIAARDYKSEVLLDSAQESARYAIDIAWLGPGIVTDDTAVYQSLINILATEFFERIFNPFFGVGVMNLLAELTTSTDMSRVISDLKSDVERQDSRITIDRYASFVSFDEYSGSLVVHLYWINNVTGNKAYLKYGYNLDTIL